MNAWDLSCRSTTSSSTFNHSLSSSPSSSRSNSLTTSDVVDSATTLKLQFVSDNATSIVSSTNRHHDENELLNHRQRHHQKQHQQLQHHQQHNELNMMNPLPLDKKARKKDQNRRAAYNYRRKKMEEKNRMREEEMRLVYSRVCLIGYAEELEGSIMYILNTKTRKISDKFGNTIFFLCPICLQSCDNILNLRSHLNIIHNNNNNNNNVDINNNSSDKCTVNS